MLMCLTTGDRQGLSSKTSKERHASGHNLSGGDTTDTVRRTQN